MSATPPTWHPSRSPQADLAYSYALVATAIMAVAYVIIHTVNTLLDQRDHGLAMPVTFTDPAAGPAIDNAEGTTTQLMVKGANIVVPTQSLSGLAITLLSAAVIVGAATIVLTLAFAALAGWRAFHSTLLRPAGSRLLEWLASAAILAGMAALGTQTLGINTALADLNLAYSGEIERGGFAMSPWVWLAVFWAILLVSRAWTSARALAKQTEGLV